MKKFKEFYKKRKKKRLGKPSGPPDPVNLNHNLNNKHYANIPPYGTPPTVGNFSDDQFPSYPTSQ